MIIDKDSNCTLEQLKSLLTKARIGFASWEPDKTIEHLHEEIREGLVELTYSGDFEDSGDGSSIECRTHSAVIDICRKLRDNPESRQRQKLYEVERIVGGTAKAPRTLHSASEKIHAGQKPIEAVKRCLRMKFGMSGEIAVISSCDTGSPFKDIDGHLDSSTSTPAAIVIGICMYEKVIEADQIPRPGLAIVRELHHYLCQVPPSALGRKRFERTHGDKKTVYEWRIATSPELMEFHARRPM